MTYPRVNLLKKNEQRYQGAVSQKFILIGAVAAPILLIALISGVQMIQFRLVKSKLQSSHEIWKELEPRLTLYTGERRGLETSRKALGLFEGWNNSQTSFVKLLNDIQEVVPENIQFTRLSVRSQPSASLYTDAKEMKLDFSLVVEGNSQGARAENHVMGLRKDLLTCEQVGCIFDSLELASMRKRESATGKSICDFRFEGKATKGGRL